MGSLHPDGGPTGVFHCRNNDFVSIMVMPYQWLQMTKAMNMPELAEDARFRDPRSRRDNNKALQAIIENWLEKFENREQTMAALAAERVPGAPEFTFNEAIGYPDLR